MITYPSTHGIFEVDIKEMCEIVHACGVARKSSRSILPFSSHLTVTVLYPHWIALAGLVPWAEAGSKTISRIDKSGYDRRRCMSLEPA